MGLIRGAIRRAATTTDRPTDRPTTKIMPRPLLSTHINVNSATTSKSALTGTSFLARIEHEFSESPGDYIGSVVASPSGEAGESPGAQEALDVSRQGCGYGEAEYPSLPELNKVKSEDSFDVDRLWERMNENAKNAAKDNCAHGDAGRNSSANADCNGDHDSGETNGSDHTHDDHVPKRPQHYEFYAPSSSVSPASQKQAQHNTPHGAMTSILSAAGATSSFSPDRNYKSPSGNGKQQTQPPSPKRHNYQQQNHQQQQTQDKEKENITKKALRLRAKKYFHRGNSISAATAAALSEVADIDNHEYRHEMEESTLSNEDSEAQRNDGDDYVGGDDGNEDDNNVGGIFIDSNGIPAKNDDDPNYDSHSTNHAATPAPISKNLPHNYSSSLPSTTLVQPSPKITTRPPILKNNYLHHYHHAHTSTLSSSSMTFFPRTTAPLTTHHTHPNSHVNNHTPSNAKPNIIISPSVSECNDDPALQTYHSDSDDIDEIQSEIRSQANS